MPTKFDDVPAELKALNRWVPFKYFTDEKGKFAKKPLGTNDDPRTWRSFDKAAAAGEGIALAMTRLDGYAVIDLDGCLVDGVLSSWAREILERFPPTYVETTPSGAGVHLVFTSSIKVPDRSYKLKSEAPVGGKVPGFEIFGGKEAGQFCTFTGDVWPGYEDMAEIDLEALAWLNQLYPLYKVPASEGEGADAEVGDMPDLPEALPDVREGDIRNWAFWTTGEADDRSSVLFTLARELVERWGAAIALGLLWDNAHCRETALDHRQGDEDRALAFLWENCVKAAAKKLGAREVSTLFEDLGVDLEAPANPLRYIRDKKGQILNTAQNCVTALQDPRMGFVLGYDLFRDEVMFARRPGEWEPMTDSVVFEMRCTMDRMGFKDTSPEKTKGAMHHVAWNNRFDSAQLWLSSLAWDGVPRVASFCSRYLGSEDSDYTRALSLYMWTAAAGRIIEPGVKADSTVVLISPEGRRKSSAVRAMCPDESCFTELNLQRRDEDISRQLRGKLIAEWGELAGMSKKDVLHVKTFSSRQTEAWIPKFKEFETQFPRRCIFIGTTNEDEFLVSDSGNRRFYPMHIDRCDYVAVKEDRDQLWAEAAVLFKKGGVAWEEAHALGKEYQLRHEVQETEFSEQIQCWLDMPWFDDGELPGQNSDRMDMTSLLIAKEALGFQAKEIHMGVRARITRAMKQLGWEIKQVWVNQENRKRKFYRKNEG